LRAAFFFLCVFAPLREIFLELLPPKISRKGAKDAKKKCSMPPFGWRGTPVSLSFSIDNFIVMLYIIPMNCPRFVLPVLALLLLCAGAPAVSALSLADAIEQSANDIAGQIPPKSRVAIAAFQSPSSKLSEYIMEELTGALFAKGIEVADRRNLEYVYNELYFQRSWELHEKDAQSIGKFLAAQFVITGQLISQYGAYSYRTSAIHVELAVVAFDTRLEVQNDQTMQDLAASMADQKTTTTTKYGVDEKIAPQTPGTFLDRGILFAACGDYERAIRDFTQALRLDPDMPGAYNSRGLAHFARTDYDQAIADFTQAINLDSNYAAAYYNRALVYASKGNYDRAIDDYNQAIRLNPKDDWTYNNRGIAYYNKEDYDRAIQDYTKAISLNPNNAEAYYNRGLAYYDKEDYDHAIEDYTQALRLDPNDTWSYNNRGLAYCEKLDYDRAIADFTQAIRRDPNLSGAYYNRGLAYYFKGDYDRAIADYTRVIRLDPNDAGTYYNRGVAYDEKGDIDKAIADWESVLRINPNHPEARQSFEAARQQRGW